METSLAPPAQTKSRQGHERLKSTLLGFLLAFVGLAAAAYVASAPAPRDGLELMWIVPLSFAASTIIFSSILGYHRGGIGLKVLYLVVLVRYIIVPVLITATSGAVTPLMVSASAEGYRFAVFATAIEIFIYGTTISLAWPRVRARVMARDLTNTRPRPRELGLTLGGGILIGVLSLVILLRGMDGVRSSFGFLMLTEKYDDIPVDSFAVTAIQAMKSFLYVCIAILCQKRYRKHHNIGWFLVATIAAFLNIVTYFGYNRSLILQTALATMATLILVFPSMRKQILIALIPVTALVLYALITLKQFGVSADSGEVGNAVSLESLSQTLETYVNGPWPLATGYDAATSMAQSVSLLTPLRTFTDNVFLFKVPGFTWPNELLSGVPSVLDLYQDYTWPALGSMLPLSSEMWFYGDFLMGPVLVVAGNTLVAYLLVQVEIRSRLTNGAQHRFIYAWTSTLFGLAMCYCLVTIVWSLSKFVFFLAIIFWINSRVVLQRRRAEPLA